MTKEMEVWDKSFQDFLTSIDIKYSDYFASSENEVGTVKRYFATINGANLRYVGHDLRLDIFEEVVSKHKEIWGEWHHYAELS